MRLQPHQNGGYIALMTTIIIALMLLLMVVEGASQGALTRHIVLGTEAKEQSLALAEGCVDIARAMRTVDPTYQGGKTYTLGEGSCSVLTILQDKPSPGHETLRVRATARDAETNLEVVLDQTSALISFREVSSF